MINKNYFANADPNILDNEKGLRHRYYDALKKRREKSGQGLASENIAIRKLLEVKTDLINDPVKRVDNSDITVSEWLDIWYNTHESEWGVSTRVQRKEAIKILHEAFARQKQAC